jgi:predicted Rossmann fold nucleotide-binding protein DprA/Smf involved in DNA uptake
VGSIRKIVSGGQTGADRAALDFALENGIEIGGFVPKGRLAEDGPLSAKYQNLVETESGDCDERTRLNVLHSDATLILSNGKLSGGSKLTESIARQNQKPVLHIDFQIHQEENAIGIVIKWLEHVHPAILNIAGPRASEDLEIYQMTLEFLTKLIKKG